MEVEGSRVVDPKVGLSLIDGSVQLNGHVREDDEPSDDFLEDFETYWQDISDRLTVSRMVNDSVIKGMVNAVEEEAERRITEKEAEMAVLKETLYHYHVGIEDAQCFDSPVVCREEKDPLDGVFCDRIEESLRTLGNIAKIQLKKVKREICCAKGADAITRIDSGSRLAGFDGMVLKQVSDRWSDVDKSLHSLAGTVEFLCREVDNIAFSTQTSVGDWQQEQEFLGEIEDMVTRSCIRGLQERHEEKTWEQSAKFCGKEAANCVEKINEISSLCEQLEAIAKSISHIETGYIASHGLDMGEEYSDGKSIDYLYRKNLGHVWEGNGKHEVSKLNLPEIDPNQLKNMESKELIHFYNNEITMMKRNHESQLQAMTEELYTHKREVLRLKEKGPPVPLKRDKEMDALRKKIREFIPEMERVIKETDRFSYAKGAESIGSMKERLEALVLENNHLKDSLTDKKKEIRVLSLQVTDAVERVSENSAVEVHFLNLIGSLQIELEDAHIEAAVREDVYECVLRELTGQVRCIIEESVLNNNVMQDIYETLFEDAVQCAKSNSEYEIEDYEVEDMITKELSGVVFREALEDTAEEVHKLRSDHIKENEIRVSFELAAMTKENLLREQLVENERLKQDLADRAASRTEKEKFYVELASELAKQRDQLVLASQERDKLKDQTSHQQVLISKAAEELNVTRDNLVAAQRLLEQFKEKVKEIDEERKKLISLITQEKQSFIQQSDTREWEHRKQLKSTILFIQEFMKSVAEMESGVREGCRKVSSRLGYISSQVDPLVQKANTLRKTRSNYKQRLEKKCTDLQKAEAEVDILGDEMDTLLSLLEKIYIALDHYSPILQHYPGITEILKLVKRELCGQSTRTF